jgi:hypothetical protein
VTEERLAAPPTAAIRDEVLALIAGELLGPAGGPEEEIEEPRVLERYVLGTLAPRHVPVKPGHVDSLAVEGNAATEEGDTEPGDAAAPTMFPSALGMTFSVDADVTELTIATDWARYRRQPRQGDMPEGRSANVWRRYPVTAALRIPLTEGEIAPLQLVEEQPRVVIRGRVRSVDDEWLVSLFLVNDQRQPERNRDEAWLFQVKLAVEDPQGRDVFVRRPAVGGVEFGDADEDERRILEMLYRYEVEFAVGHGVGVHAEMSESDPRRARRIVTRTMPSFDVPRTDPPSVAEVPELADVTLDMMELSEATRDTVRAMLEPLVVGYRGWVEQQRARIADPKARLIGFEDAAGSALTACESAATRIEYGVGLLASDSLALDAFRFANRVMWLQRVRSLAAADRRRDPKLGIDGAIAARDVPASRTWRPFQLAFILLNLPSLVDPKHLERGPGNAGLVDLLWFPTGGGKTEAYLGLVAFCMAIRRLQGTVAGRDGGAGVAAIMRYTLRLLTIQQFQRAAALIAACEVLRRERVDTGDESLGTEPFRVGLWVGRGATPNATDDADTWVKQKRGAAFAGGQSGSPAQLTACPWCGSDIDPAKHIKVDMTVRRTYLFCGDKYGACPFTEKQAPEEGLPVLVVDEEIYRHPPALLISTVDKFAQMPWRGPITSLFGRVTRRCPRHGYRSADMDWDADSHPAREEHPAVKTEDCSPLRPPDLIIQDELHLIAGPLGSMVGLYETAVDRLATWTVDGQDVRPKVIASTATVRRAGFQAYQLFWRRLEVFPPPGLDAKDSFWARQREPSDEVPGRRYVGICAQGRQFKSVLIRVFVAQMAAAQTLYEKYGKAVDPYMTVVGYFNSLKDLGGMRRHIEDDVTSRLGRMDLHGLARRQRPFIEELTSRRSSSEIPKILDRVGVSFDPALENYPIDVLLATNMISVGIDVPRLGAMIVAGQPKATAEYIQATSRVGRETDRPGLIFTVYGWARPRDLSHYERFEHYHATFYRQVEALSVTPFADRARDRALTGMLVSLLRQSDMEWNPETAAGEVDVHASITDDVAAYLKARCADLASDSKAVTEIEQEIERVLSQWELEQRVPGRKLAYRSRKDGVTQGLLRSPEVGEWQTFTTPTSLRNVEPGVNLLLLQDRLGDHDLPAFEFPAPADDEGELEDEEELA